MRKLMVTVVGALLAGACAASSPDPIATGVPEAPGVQVVEEAEQPTAAEPPGDLTGDDEPAAVDGDAEDVRAERISDAATFERLKETDCFGYPAVLGARFRCSTFYVPANEAAPDGRLLGLELVRIGRIGSQAAGRVEQAPAVFVQGGPGASALDLVAPLWEDFFEPLSEERDVIVVDQRGTGFSDPAVFCESVIGGFEENFRRFTTDIPQQVLDRSAGCRDAALRQIELDVFSARASARDLVALREAMGLDRWHVFGVSHGTRVALEMAAIDEGGTASLVLDSLHPLGTASFASIPETFERSLERLYADCDADANCSAQFGDGFEQLPELVEELNDSPLFVDQDFGPRLRVDGGVFMSLIHQFLYSPDGARTVPQLISDAAAGDTERLEVVLSISPTLFFGTTSEFVLLAHICVDEDVDAFVSPAELDLYDLVSTHAVLATHAAAVCDVLGLEHRPSEHELTDTPTLVLAGDYDPITSPVLAETFTADLPNAEYVLVPYSGHTPSFDGECTLGMVREFMSEPDAELDTTCIDDIEAPAFTADEALVQEVELFTLTDGLTTVTGNAPIDWFAEDLGFQLVWSRNRNALDSAVLSVLIEQVAGTDQGFIDEIGLIFPDAEVVDNGSLELGGLEWQEIRTDGGGLQGTFRRWTDGETAVVVLVLGITDDLAELEPLFDDVTESIQIDTGR